MTYIRRDGQVSQDVGFFRSIRNYIRSLWELICLFFLTLFSMNANRKGKSTGHGFRGGGGGGGNSPGSGGGGRGPRISGMSCIRPTPGAGAAGGG
eukprot:g3188.t1